MATARGRDFDYDQVQFNSNFPTGYYEEEVESIEQRHLSTARGKEGKVGYKPAGALEYRVTTRIRNVGEATDKYEDQVAYHSFVIGAEGDEEGDDPKTWLDPQNFHAKDLISFLVACKLVKGKEGRPEGKGTPPWEAIDEVERCRFIDHKGIKGEYQTHRYYAVGEREPGLLGEGATPIRRAARQPEPVAEEARPTRRVREPEPEVEEQPERPMRRRA